jgi:hypothetical protein
MVLLVLLVVHQRFLDIYGISYNQICGKIIRYQDQTLDAFAIGQGQSQQIDGHYVEVTVSLTYGRNPRKPIWTFAAALHEIDNIRFSSVLVLTETLLHLQHRHLALLDRTTYFCDTGSTEQAHGIFMVMIHCGMENDCCDLNNPPQFSEATTISHN